MESVGLFAPTVFLAGDSYQIVVRLRMPGMLYIRVGDRTYADHSNGVVRSDGLVRKVKIPQKCLDEEGRYTLRFVPLPERGPYFPKVGNTCEETYDFRPAGKIEKDRPVKIYMLADTHGRVDTPVKTAGFFGEMPDLLVLDGDIADQAQDLEHIDRLFALSAAVVQGTRPVLFARGNHDTRGAMAEKLPDMIGTRNGKTYFPFRTGNLWGIVLDCGEDKPDGNEEYGGENGVAFFHEFREEQTRFLEEICREHPYDDPEIRYRICICHMPFTQTAGKRGGTFDIERKNHAEWTRLLNRIGIRLLLAGHMHRAYFVLPGDERDEYGQEFATVVGSEVSLKVPEAEMPCIGTAVILGEDGITVALTDEEHRVREEKKL